MDPRRAGVLAHPTSLPGAYGLGDVGPETLRFLDWAAEAGFSVWQVLPLGPVGEDGSPYAGPSAFAGNPWLISPDLLAEEGLLPRADPPDTQQGSDEWADFERAISTREALLRSSWQCFRREAQPAAQRQLEEFREHPDQVPWLDDWTLYAALKQRHGGRPWPAWDRELRERRPAALRAAERELREEIALECFAQFTFFRQWRDLRRAAAARRIEILGDLPFYVAHDSAEVWARPELFLLDAEGRPLKLAGVPPDYFSETGQLWGNPIYHWERMADDGFSWWIERLRLLLRRVDRVRLDHFRAFVAHWEVDAGETTAVRGRWVPAPGRALFAALRRQLGELPLVAEDLGLITDDVRTLRQELGLPGMRILQFAFGDGQSEHLPENLTPDIVVYSGTHDNDTTRGWFESLAEPLRQDVLARLGAEPRTVAWRMIETAYGSPAGLAVVPLQDLFGLGSEARMNRPGQAKGNWRWRARADRFDMRLAARLRELTERSGRRAGALL